jgi:hypothetical protein
MEEAGRDCLAYHAECSCHRKSGRDSAGTTVDSKDAKGWALGKNMGPCPKIVGSSKRIMIPWAIMRVFDDRTCHGIQLQWLGEPWVANVKTKVKKPWSDVLHVRPRQKLVIDMIKGGFHQRSGRGPAVRNQDAGQFAGGIFSRPCPNGLSADVRSTT